MKTINEAISELEEGTQYRTSNKSRGYSDCGMLEGLICIDGITRVYSEDLLIEGFGGEIYTPPMTAKSTWGERTKNVKKGEDANIALWPFFKKVTTEIKTKIVNQLHPHECCGGWYLWY